MQILLLCKFVIDLVINRLNVTQFILKKLNFLILINLGSGKKLSYFCRMSSLQQQLASLAGQTRQVATLRKASILFDEKELQKISTQTIFSIGLNGLLELVKINEQFAPYENTLFSKSSVQFNRQIQTKEENKKLDVAISNFLIILSPYLLLKPAQKALEYLIRRYQ